MNPVTGASSTYPPERHCVGALQLLLSPQVAVKDFGGIHSGAADHAANHGGRRARAAGVSRALVSLVIRDSPKVSERSRRDVLAAAERLGYRPNLMARNLASRRTMTIGVLLNDLHNPFFAEVADGILAAADESDYRVLFSTGRVRPAVESHALEAFLELRVDGIILVGSRLPRAAIEAAAPDRAARRRRPSPAVIGRRHHQQPRAGGRLPRGRPPRRPGPRAHRPHRRRSRRGQRPPPLRVPRRDGPPRPRRATCASSAAT